MDDPIEELDLEYTGTYIFGDDPSDHVQFCAEVTKPGHLELRVPTSIIPELIVEVLRGSGVKNPEESVRHIWNICATGIDICNDDLGTSGEVSLEGLDEDSQQEVIEREVLRIMTIIMRRLYTGNQTQQG